MFITSAFYGENADSADILLTYLLVFTFATTPSSYRQSREVFHCAQQEKRRGIKPMGFDNYSMADDDNCSTS